MDFVILKVSKVDMGGQLGLFKGKLCVYFLVSAKHVCLRLSTLMQRILIYTFPNVCDYVFSTLVNIHL